MADSSSSHTFSTHTPSPDQPVQLQSQLVTVKLNESNHLLWKQQILAAIRGYGLERFIDGSSTAPHSPTDPSYLLWNRQDQLLASWILSSLSESVLICTVGLTTSKEIWDSLQSSFASQNDAKILQYRLQLQTIKKENLQMREYLNKIKTCCDLLGSAGHKVSEKDHLLYILAGLPQDYNPVLVSLSTRSPPCSIMEAYSVLMSFETRIEGFEGSNKSAENCSFAVNLTTQGQYQRGGGNARGRGRNNFNNQGGQRGRGRSNFRGSGRGYDNSKPRCQICHYNNHTADKCFYRTDLSFTPANRGNNNSYGQGGSAGQHNVNIANVGGNADSMDYNWYPDSGTLD